MDAGELKDRITNLHEEYGVDRIELSKIMVIASTTLLVVSIHASLGFQNAAEDVSKASSKLDRAEAVMNSDSFQRNLDALENVKGPRGLGNQISALTGSLEKLGEAVEGSKDAEEGLQRHSELYQWLALIAILGNVAGVALFYI